MVVFTKDKWKADIEKGKELWHLVRVLKKKYLKVVFVKMSLKDKVNWYSEMETFAEENLAMAF